MALLRKSAHPKLSSTTGVLVLSYTNADLLTRPRCQHIVLLSLESSLTHQKLGATQKSSALMNSVF